MDSSSSPPILYLGDDDDDENNDNNQNQYFQTHMSLPQASSEMHLPRKKRKLSDRNVQVNTSIVNWSKRQQRNDDYQERLSQNTDHQAELILLDPNEYVIEEPDAQSYCSFDWTIQPQPTVVPTKQNSNPMRTIPRIPIATPANTMPVNNSHDQFSQQQRKLVTRPSAPPLPLPLPKVTAPIIRPRVQRGRPVKNSRVLNTHPNSPPPSPIRSQPEPPIFASKQSTSRPPPLLPSSPTASTSFELRRQLLNGTGIFSAFHDSRYYRCNICKFKSVTSSTLLQHLFTHMFFCDHCSFYTYSYYNHSQHLFEKHHVNLIEDIHEPLNPKSFDLLYVTRCSDGTFALCMDSSLSTTKKASNNDQRFIISSATPNDPPQNAPPKKKLIPKTSSTHDEDNDIVLLTDTPPQPSKRKAKHNQTCVIMKHRRCYSMKKNSRLHPLTVEYNICREHTIRCMSHTQQIEKRRDFLNKFRNTRLIDEVASCLKTIVNRIVDPEENHTRDHEKNFFHSSNQSSLVQLLPNDILSSIFSADNLNPLTSLLKLNNKYDQYVEQTHLAKEESSLRQSREHMFILSSPEVNHTEQSIMSALHSSLTNGESIFTQTKVGRLPTNFDNTHRYLKGNSKNQVQKKIPSPVQLAPKPIPLRPINSKPSQSSSSSSVDRNNNSLIPSKSQPIPSIIILD